MQGVEGGQVWSPERQDSLCCLLQINRCCRNLLICCSPTSRFGASMGKERGCQQIAPPVVAVAWTSRREYRALNSTCHIAAHRQIKELMQLCLIHLHAISLFAPHRPRGARLLEIMWSECQSKPPPPCHCGTVRIGVGWSSLQCCRTALGPTAEAAASTPRQRSNTARCAGPAGTGQHRRDSSTTKHGQHHQHHGHRVFSTWHSSNIPPTFLQHFSNIPPTFLQTTRSPSHQSGSNWRRTKVRAAPRALWAGESSSCSSRWRQPSGSWASSSSALSSRSRTYRCSALVSHGEHQSQLLLVLGIHASRAVALVVLLRK